MATSLPEIIKRLRAKAGLTQEVLARILGVSYVSVNRWERGAAAPSSAQAQRIERLYLDPHALEQATVSPIAVVGAFASRGARRTQLLPLFDGPAPSIAVSEAPLAPLMERLGAMTHDWMMGAPLDTVLKPGKSAPVIAQKPPGGGLSAGKNTYTYDAHTYHTKVPPQGIAELLGHYLPQGGLVLDPFAGSGMTGVAASVAGLRCILNELSPAACFIANQFTTASDPKAFRRAVDWIAEETRSIRRELYLTRCRECRRETELLYTIWSYRVLCSACNHEFPIWEACRRYGKRVRDHEILGEFPCPACSKRLVKSRLRRTYAEPVMIAYRCCKGGVSETTAPPDPADLEKILAFELAPPVAEGFVPRTTLPVGVNLNQPRRHGFLRVDQLYTPRNLGAMSHIWRAIHRLRDDDLAAALAFTFTSLYQRVTRLSEFRFWGGSGNTPRFNVPYIFNEANVFLCFERKARSILDHMETTASHFRGRVAVHRGSACRMGWIPDGSVDLVFTDPPFGGNINYSEMNLLWESWLGVYTETAEEAIINKFQSKGIDDYARLIERSLAECHRVLRADGWLIMMFMNSSGKVWQAIQNALLRAGFEVVQVDVFDKQHGTFKHHVSRMTPGCDLVLHCRKAPSRLHTATAEGPPEETATSVREFLSDKPLEKYKTVYLHVSRDPEVDYRQLYSEWLAARLVQGRPGCDFETFLDFAERVMASRDKPGRRKRTE